MVSPEPIAVYVHIPFCPSKCGYCDFNSYVLGEDAMEETVRATIAEIERSPLYGRPAKTLFFGGGTPTFLPESLLLRVFEAVLRAHPPVPGAEITSEANPGTVDRAKFRAMRAAGFNRISLGAQSFLDSDLHRLGRVHRAGEIERAVEAAREAGFENLNLDLMFALPEQSLRAWEANLDRALALSPEHLSLYCLTIEPGTAFFTYRRQGRLPLPEEDDQAEMYARCAERAREKGFEHYEISNFARPGRACEHNLCYWRGESYAGYGPGAVATWPAGSVESIALRTTTHRHPRVHAEALAAGESPWQEREPLSEEVLRTERLMLGLRLAEGVETEGLAIEADAVERLFARGWLEEGEGRIRLTEAGRPFCSEVTLALL